MGVDIVEFDVRLCRDALVRLHDDHLTQYAGAPGLASLLRWTVDAPQRMRELQVLGVDGIATNHPELFAELN